MACDICDAKGTTLTDLRDDYKTADIQQVCPDCARLVNDKVWKIREMLDGVMKTLVRRFMTERRGRR